MPVFADTQKEFRTVQKQPGARWQRNFPPRCPKFICQPKLFLNKLENMERPVLAENADLGIKAGRQFAVRYRGLLSCDSRAAYETSVIRRTGRGKYYNKSCNGYPQETAYCWLC